jgi:hypothetical protein
VVGRVCIHEGCCAQPCTRQSLYCVEHRGGRVRKLSPEEKVARLVSRRKVASVASTYQERDKCSGDPPVVPGRPGRRRLTVEERVARLPTCMHDGCSNRVTATAAYLEGRDWSKGNRYCAEHRGGVKKKRPLLPCSAEGCSDLATRVSSQDARTKKQRAYCEFHKGLRRVSSPRLPLLPCTYPGCSEKATWRTSNLARSYGAEARCAAHLIRKTRMWGGDALARAEAEVVRLRLLLLRYEGGGCPNDGKVLGVPVVQVSCSRELS